MALLSGERPRHHSGVAVIPASVGHKHPVVYPFFSVSSDTRVSVSWPGIQAPWVNGQPAEPGLWPGSDSVGVHAPAASCTWHPVAGGGRVQSFLASFNLN